ncbi:MAG: glucose-6-phosphate dehydrogenase [Sulfuriflexus sp.]|nr:glucose-6-phosphate dehydrogenase [Sulfuriflexus sp.]
MSDRAQVVGSIGMESQGDNPTSEPCVMVIFGASGDLTKRLLVPALYNLACDDLLSKNFAVLGTGRSEITDDEFRESMSSEENGLRGFHTRNEFDEPACDELMSRFHFVPGGLDDPENYKNMKKKVDELNEKFQAKGNVLFYFAMAPRFFGMICDHLYKAGFQSGEGWRRIIVEKPFGTDLESALELNKAILANWREDQIFRVDHYLGKETVQNLLAFRFSNGMFEPLWNKDNIDNIQFNVCESVDVGERGGYYDSSGVLRDMMQNHMFQMLAYLCMEVPGSFEPDSIRNEKAKLLESVRIYDEDSVPENIVRGQYGPSFTDDGEVDQPGYRQSTDVNPESSTETFVAAKFQIDNWRWEGVPIYLRSGKALWKRGTEIVVEFKKPPQQIFKGTSVENLTANRLVFHVQPYQAIELLFQAKIPGPTLQLQNVDMEFNYGDNFKASRYTGYEVMIYSCTHGDATLFSRGDLVEAAWRIAQPIMDYWSENPAKDFPNYTRNSWGPKSANDLIEKDGRRWFEVVTPDVLEQLPLFEGADPLLLNSIIMALHADAAEAGEVIIQQGDMAKEMYLICRGEVEVVDAGGNVLKTLKDGDFFGEVGILMSTPRTATIRAKTLCDLFVLQKSDFGRILQDHPQFAENIMKIAKERYDLAVSADELMA